jgi:hypothetical protein
MDTLVFYEINNLYYYAYVHGRKTNFFVNGIELNDYGCVLQNKPTEAKRLIKTQKVAQYKNDAGETMPVEEYKSTLDQLHDKQYDSLEDEYKMKLFYQTWKPEIEFETTEELASISIINIDVDFNNIPPFTTPCRLMDSSPTNMTLFVYNPKAINIFSAVAKEYSMIYGDHDDKNTNSLVYSVPDHSLGTLRFLKFGERYTNYDSLKLNTKVLGTLNECIDAHNYNVKMLKEFIELELAKDSKKTLNPASIKYVINMTNNIKSTLKKIPTNSKNYSDINACLDFANTLLKKLVEIHHEC